MIHVVTAANRAIYARQIEEMHRLRWAFYVEGRKWRELREMQAEPGIERDEYDDEQAVYLMGLDDDGHITGSMRLRPTHQNSLLSDKFMHLVDDPATFERSPYTWEITRLFRKPENRTKDYALRFSTNAAMLETALSRGVTRLVGAGELFFLPYTRQLWRHKFRLLGLPTPFEEGEFIAYQFDVDEESLRMVREAAGFIAPQMFELPAPVPGRVYDPVKEERLARLISTASPERLAELETILAAPAADRREDVGAQP